MNMFGQPVKLEVLPDRGPDTYLIAFFNSGSVEIEADEIEWGSAFVRFYTRPEPTERVLVHAFNVTTVEEVRELVDK